MDDPTEALCERLIESYRIEAADSPELRIARHTQCSTVLDPPARLRSAPHTTHFSRLAPTY